jgi:hypothetical protein
MDKQKACSMDKQEAYSMDRDMQHVEGHAVGTGACSMDLDRRHEHRQGVDIDYIQYWTSADSRGLNFSKFLRKSLQKFAKINRSAFKSQRNVYAEELAKISGS